MIFQPCPFILNNQNNVMEQQTDSIEIGLIAACLADNYMEHLYNLSEIGYINALHEISAWSHEFYHAYHEKLKDWETFESSTANIYGSVCWDDFLIAWGAERIRKFFN